MPRLPAEVMLATCFDEQHPARNVLTGDDTFFTTTGMYPQEVLFNFPSEEDEGTVITLDTLYIRCQGVRRLRIDICNANLPTEFVTAAEAELPEAKAPAMQEGKFSLSQQPARYVKLVILEGRSQFSAIQTVRMDGDVERA